MTITERSFILVQESSDTIIVEDKLEDLLIKEIHPIVWFRDGLFCIVPAAILQNMLDMFNTVPFIKDEQRKINWGQGCTVEHDVGHLLTTWT